ncbi:MAG TPA: D-arabinono-1,4-lactone oxidase, partial [Pyrinomonadaceae bacterium]
HTTLNIMLNALTFGKFLWLEGRVLNGLFRNWGRRFRYKPRHFEQPTSEEELIYLIKQAKDLRFFGSAHSFNDGVVADTTLVSLDRYAGVVREDRVNKRLTVKGGTRVRDVVAELLKRGWAFAALPSHDAQSIAGILSTDVHGTGRKWGFVSETVVDLRIIDSNGQVKTVGPTDDLFRAAIGGVGAVGVISEVTVQAVDHFHVAQKFEISDLSYVESHLEEIINNNDHVSFYLFPFTTRCQISTWNRTEKPKSFLGPLREFIAISFDALLAAWFGGLMAYTGTLKKFSHATHGLKLGTNLVLESNKAFNRTIYHLHQELEFTVPYEKTWEMSKKFVGLFEYMYLEKPIPYPLFEVRFTPAGHDRTLIGAGRGQRSTWIDLVLNDSNGFEGYYAAAERTMKEVGARPHLGKFCELHTRADMEKLHSTYFTKFLEIRDQQDPQRKFANEFTRRLFGP